MTAGPREVTVHIDRLVLEGIPLGPGAADRVGAAVAATVRHKLAAGGVAPALLSGPTVRSVDGGSVVLPAPGPAVPAQLGHRIGGQLARHMSAGDR